MQELRNTLRPEFLNRIDEVVIFAPLGREALDRIVDIQLGHLRHRLAARRIELSVTDAARALLGREGYDPTFGARPLKRAIQRLVQDPLSLKLLQREFADGDSLTADARATRSSSGARRRRAPRAEGPRAWAARATGVAPTPARAALAATSFPS